MADTASNDASIRSIPGLLTARAAGGGQRSVFLSPGRPDLSYEALLQQVNDTVAVLNAHGIRRDDRAAVVLPNGPEMAVTFVAVASGATAAPLNPSYKTDELNFYFSDLEAKALIVDPALDSPAAEVAQSLGIPVFFLESGADRPAGAFTLACRSGDRPPATDPVFAESGDIALVLHTSGTTSRPKIVPLSHANVCASAFNIVDTLALTSEDRCLNIMPLFHIHGLMGAVLSSLAAGAELVATPGFDAMRFFRWLGDFRPTWYTAVPTMHQAILARAGRNEDIVRRAKLRLIRSSSSALPPQVMKTLEDTFRAPVIESYGMTEAAHQMASNPLPPAPRKPGSVGLPAGPEIAVMNDAGALLAAGETAEVVIRGANVTAGYDRNPDANKNAYSGGWFRTGDQGYFDADGYLFITGRLKEIINCGGEKVSPREVDEVLLDHPAVRQAVTFAMPHRMLGEDVAAAIVLAENKTADAREIRDFAAERLAPFKVPGRVVFLDEIPKGPTGKLQRIGLAQKLGLA